MKKSIALAAVLAIASCNPKKDFDLVISAEAYLKGQMKDPSSFQVVKASIVDTIMLSNWLRDRYNQDTALVSRTIASNESDLELQNFEPGERTQKAAYEKLLDSKTNIYRQGAAKDSQDLTALKQDSIFFITVRVAYRAKNSFGALDADTKTINYYPRDSTFKITE